MLIIKVRTMSYPNFYRQCPANSVPYTIRAGDTLNSIAKQYNTVAKDILNINPGINPNSLRIGMQICVPLILQLYPSCPTTNYYIVRPGDTFDSIASYFNITYQQLLYSNYGIGPNDLYVDQVLCIPVAPSPVNVEVNLNAKKLFVFKNGGMFRTYTIGIANPNIPIPKGNFTVVNKQVDPGTERGARWLGLSEPGLGIHGTNTPTFIQNISTGKSILMSNIDVSEFFNLVPVGTIIKIV